MGAWIHQRYNGGSTSNTWPETAISDSETLLAGGRRRTIIILPTATKKWTASPQLTLQKASHRLKNCPDYPVLD